MKDEKIKVRATSNGQMLEVIVFSKRLNSIQIVLGEGVHSVRCELTPTRNGSAYVGNAMGREALGDSIGAGYRRRTGRVESK